MRRQLAALVTVLLVATAFPASTLAADATPPTGTAELWAIDEETQLAELRLSYVDPESALAEVSITCDANPTWTGPYAARVYVPVLDPTKGGCTGYGSHTLIVQVRNAAGLWSGPSYVQVEIVPDIDLELPVPAVTGSPFTIRPVFPTDFTLADTDVCRWEFRWGSTPALRENEFDFSFGSLLFEGPRSKGYCGDWTFTLPWVPVRQFQVSFSHARGLGEPAIRESIGFDDPFITATVGTTERRITSSNLGLMQVLPDAYELIVGVPTTYRLYPLGGATVLSADSWIAACTCDWENAYFTKTGGSTFTFTPNRAGSWFVSWNGGPGRTYVLGGTYDPPARYPDTSAPVISAGPYPRIRTGGTVGATIPATLSWAGSDRGWGLRAYQVQVSRNGGSWASISLPSPLTTRIQRALTASGTYRFRVRAIDKAGNVGAWKYTATLSPRRVSDNASTVVTYRGTWPKVSATKYIGGSAHRSSSSTASVTYRVYGRSVAWVGSVGPGLGSARVYFDGVYVQTVNLSAATAAERRVLYARRWSSLGTHTLTIRPTGSGPVYVDGFVRFR